ncbi:MAG: divergent polysaccharide deacetylase family protein [Candidatus Omnitrophota bacterium]
MAASGKGKKSSSWLVVIIWVIVAFLCFQGYLLFSRQNRLPLISVVQQPQRPPVLKPPVKPAKPLKPLPAGVTGRIAVILDDWGYNRNHCKYLSEFDAPVTPAIMPDLPYSRDVLRCAMEAGQDAMLHLPMEPYVVREKYPQGYMLTTAMPQREVQRLLNKVLNEFKGIVGVNNHEGSRGTESPELMTTVMAELKNRGLFFVDSLTSAKSVCSPVAARIGVLFARRNIFLDNRNDRAAIEHQFELAAKIAKEKGFVVIIGHDRVLTMQILTEQIRKLKSQGYVFMRVKDFIQARRP